MSADISAELRRLIGARARYRCEYCLLPESLAAHRHEPDHIIPVQHGGETTESNLALACMRCNRFKGPNVRSFDPETGALVPFYNPRRHAWTAHFRLEAAVLRPLTAEARVTVKILRLNDADRVEERALILKRIQMI